MLGTFNGVVLGTFNGVVLGTVNGVVLGTVNGVVLGTVNGVVLHSPTHSFSKESCCYISKVTYRISTHTVAKMLQPTF